MKRTLLPLLGISAGILLTIQGCSHTASGGSVNGHSAESWGNYKCTATSDTDIASHPVIGWAATKGAARENALDKCRSQSAQPGSCHVTDCVDEGVTG